MRHFIYIGYFTQLEYVYRNGYIPIAAVSGCPTFYYGLKYTRLESSEHCIQDVYDVKNFTERYIADVSSRVSISDVLRTLDKLADIVDTEAPIALLFKRTNKHFDGSTAIKKWFEDNNVSYSILPE